MRAVFPILLVILGLGVANYASARLPSGLADADLEEVAQLAREGAIDVLDWAAPNWRDDNSRGSVRRHRHRHSQRMRHSSHDTRSRTRFRVQEDISEHLVEITFVALPEKKAETVARRRGESRRRR